MSADANVSLVKNNTKWLTLSASMFLSYLVNNGQQHKNYILGDSIHIIVTIAYMPHLIHFLLKLL